MPHTYNLLSVTGAIISLISADTLYESFENDEKFSGYQTYFDTEPKDLKTFEEWIEDNGYTISGRDYFLTQCWDEYRRNNPTPRLTFDQWKAETDDLDYKAFLCAYKEDLKTIEVYCCLLYTSPSPRDRQKSRMPSSA